MGPGLFLCLLAAGIPLFSLDPLSAGRTSMSFTQGVWTLAFLLPGLLLLFRRPAWRVRRWISHVAAAVSGLILLEATSFVAVLYLSPKEMVSEAARVLETQKKAQFQPYLWSNYAPTPGATDVNEFGWRHGGGPNRKLLRILALGGSGTWSDGATSGATSYPAQVESFLRRDGYDIDVVNAGVPYHASTETLGLFAYKALNEKPDLALIRVGENDLEPLLAPGRYRMDYTHWRDLRSDLREANALFSRAWKVPSWTLRLLSLHLLRPSGFAQTALATQLVSGEQALFADTDPRSPSRQGLERHLRSLVGVARANGVTPVLLTLRFNLDHPKSTLALYGHSKQETARARLRWGEAVEAENETIRKVAQELKVPLLPVDKFEPSSPARWRDHAHFDDIGYRELGEFVGSWLEHSKLVESARRGAPGRGNPS